MGIWTSVRNRVAITAALLIGLASPAIGRADVWVSGAGGIATEVAHRLDVTEADGCAQVTMRRTVRNDGNRAADLVLAFRLPPGAIATGLAMPSGGRASLRWAGPDLLVLALHGVPARAERQAEVLLWAPLEARHDSFDLRFLGPDDVADMAPRRVFVNNPRDPPPPEGRDRIVSLARNSPRYAVARHAYLPLSNGGLLLAELDAPRFFSPRASPGRAIAVLDVGPDRLDRALILAGAYVGRFAQGMYQVLLPGNPVEALTEDFADATQMLGALEMRFDSTLGRRTIPPTPDRTPVDRLLQIARQRLGNWPEAVRVVLVTDRPAFAEGEVEAVANSLEGLQHGSVVHVVALGDDPDALPGRRDDMHPLADTVRRHNGIVVRFDTDVADLDAASQVMGHMIRPLWVDNLDLIVGPAGTVPEPDGPGSRVTSDAQAFRVAPRLGERRAATSIQRVDAPAVEVVWQARLWVEWWTKRSETVDGMDLAVALHAKGSPWFAGLPVTDQNRLTKMTGAVTSGWSWVANGPVARHVPR